MLVQRTPGEGRWLGDRGRASSLGRRPTPLALPPHPACLDDCVLWLDAADLGSSAQTWANRGWGGPVLDATLGSTASADTNDPKVLPWGGTNYVYLPGVSNCYVSVADAANLDITGDIEFVVKAQLEDWTPSSSAGLFWRDNGDPNRGTYFYVNNAGKLGMRWFPTGSAASSIIATSSVAMPANDGETWWVKATLDVDNGAGGYDVKFYYAADDGTNTEPATWTQLGATQTGGSTTSLPAVTAAAASGAGAPGTGAFSLFRLIMRNGIGGSTVLDVNTATDVTSGSATSFTATSGQTVTVHRGTSGRKTVLVTRPCLLFGTDDYCSIADNDLLDFTATDSFTVGVIHRPWNTQGTNDALAAKKANTTDTTAGWSLTNGASTALAAAGQVGDGTAGATATGATRSAGVRTMATLVRSTGADTVTVFGDGTAGTPTTDATTATSVNSEVMRIGRLSGAGTEYADMELFAVFVARRAFTANELARIAQYYGTTP